MYLATFELQGREIVQARLRLSDDALSNAARVAAMLARAFAGARNIPVGSIAMRAALHAGRLTVGWIVTCEGADARALRELAGSLQRLESTIGFGVETPGSRHEFDDLLGPFPPRRCRLTASGFVREDVWLACDFSARTDLDAIFARCLMDGTDFAYQCNLTPNAVTSDDARRTLVNADRIARLVGAQAALVERQRRLARDSIRAPWLSEEYVGCADDGVERTASDLRRRFEAALGGLGFGDPGFTFTSTDDAFELATEFGMHEASFGGELPLDARCGCALDQAAAIDRLCWLPGSELRAMLDVRPPAATVESLPARRSALGVPPEVDAASRWCFVSYAHEDATRLRPVLDAAVAAGTALWWDRGIPGGSEWDEHLEERIRGATAVVLFVSQRAIDSRYVRREVKYADALGKPILAVELEAAEYRHGMAMLLNQYQRVRFDDDDLMHQLARLTTA